MRANPYVTRQGYRHSLRRWLEEATETEREHGLTWYARARGEVEELAARYSLAPRLVAAVVAVLSPMVRWERNMAEAELVLKRYSSGAERFDGHTAFPKNVRKAWQVLYGEDTSPVKGRKVEAFFALLAGPCDAVVLDSIAILAAVGIDPNPLVTSDDAKPYFGRPRTLRTIEHAYRDVAAEHGLAPSALQAIVWTVWRNERDKA